MSILLDGTGGVTTPGVVNTAGETIATTLSVTGATNLSALTTTGNTILGDASTDTLNVGNGGLVKDASGNVGIGTASPSSILTGSNVNLTVEGTNGADISLKRSGGAARVGLGVTSGNECYLYSSTATPLVFATNGTERMRIDSVGSFLVGTTSAVPNPGIAFAPAGNITVGNSAAATGFEFHTFRRSATQIGSITQNGTTAVAYNTSSDYRLKENIAPMTGALATVQALKPVTYSWKADGSDGQGFIAHELQAVVPDCVTGEKDAVDAEGKPVHQGIDTSFLVATLTAAIQELKAIVDAQAARIAALES